MLFYTHLSLRFGSRVFEVNLLYSMNCSHSLYRKIFKNIISYVQ